MIDICPLCNHKDYSLIYNIDEMPIFQNKVYASVNLAKKAKTHNLSLVHCNNCNFIFNKKFVSDIMEYDETYQNEQSHSIFFKNYLNSIIDIFHEKFNLNTKIIEIGSGKGYFLNLLEEHGFNNVFGFDPAYEGNKKNITKDYFSSKYKDINADLIILRHTLEHVINPFNFLQDIAKANNYNGKIFIEVPCFEWIKSKEAFWDVFYEHCNYFTKDTLSSMFEQSEVGVLFNSQYIYVLADLKDLKSSVIKSNKLVRKNIFENSLTKYLKFIQNNKCCIWGAGAKGVTFLNVLDPEMKLIQYVVDINPKKQNQYIGKSTHEVIDISILKKYIENKEIDSVVIMNNNYREEILEELKIYNINYLILGEIDE